MNVAMGFDLDGVLYDWFSACVPLLRVLGFDVQNEVEAYQIFISAPETFQNNIMNITSYYRTIVPSESIVDTVRFIGKKYEIYYITSRPKIAEYSTRKWLEEHKFPYVNNLIVTNNKPAIVRQLGLKFYVEDREFWIRKLLNLTNVIYKKNFYAEDIDGTYANIYSVEELKEIV